MAGDTTVVTVNYRLGALGCLADPGVGANCAVLDHVADGPARGSEEVPVIGAE
jgi:carboxylesterase type B